MDLKGTLLSQWEVGVEAAQPGFLPAVHEETARSVIHLTKLRSHPDSTYTGSPSES